MARYADVAELTGTGDLHHSAGGPARGVALSLGFFDPSPPAEKFKRGFDEDPEYQMVPLGETRTVLLHSFLNEPGDVFVFVDDRSKARIKNFFGTSGAPPEAADDGLVLHSNSAVLLTIEGIAPGRTRIVAESATLGRRRSCRLSVKPRLPITYQLAVLSDGIHVPDFNLCSRNLAANMQGAERIWRDHANIELKRVGAINDVKVPWDLKDPIVIDDPVNFARIVQSTLTKDFAQAQLYIYCTWDIVYHNSTLVGGSTAGNLCFIENQFNGRVGELICAHEVGHALGLRHPTLPDPEQLMTGDPIFDERVRQAEIEHINPL